jgi:hypothetical protein
MIQNYFMRKTDQNTSWNDTMGIKATTKITLTSSLPHSPEIVTSS